MDISANFGFINASESWLGSLDLAQGGEQYLYQRCISLTELSVAEHVEEDIATYMHERKIVTEGHR